MDPVFANAAKEARRPDGGPLVGILAGVPYDVLGSELRRQVLRYPPRSPVGLWLKTVTDRIDGDLTLLDNALRYGYTACRQFCNTGKARIRLSATPAQYRARVLSPSGTAIRTSSVAFAIM